MFTSIVSKLSYLITDKIIFIILSKRNILKIFPLGDLLPLVFKCRSVQYTWSTFRVCDSQIFKILYINIIFYTIYIGVRYTVFIEIPKYQSLSSLGLRNIDRYSEVLISRQFVISFQKKSSICRSLI